MQMMFLQMRLVLKMLLVLAQAQLLLGLVEERSVAVGILLTAGLVLDGLAGGLLGVWDDVTGEKESVMKD